MNTVASAGQLNIHSRGTGMPGNIGQRLLHDAEQMRFGLIGQASVEAGLVVNIDTGPLAKSLGQPSNAGVEASLYKRSAANWVRTS